LSRFLRWAFLAVVAVVILITAAAAALPYLIDTPRVQSLIAANAAHALGRPVTFTSMKVTVFPRPAVELRDLAVAEDPRFGPGPFLTLERGVVRLRLLPLLTGRLEFGTVVLKKPLITVVQDAEGRFNVATLRASSEPRTASPGRSRSPGGPAAAAALVPRMRLEDGAITYVGGGAGGKASRYRVDGVDLTLDGAPGAITFRGAVRVKPGDVAVKVTDGSLAISPGRPLTDGAVRGRVSLDGKDVRELVAAVAGPSPVLDAGIKGTLALAGTLGSPRASGDVELLTVSVAQTSPRCPRPKERTLKLQNVKLSLAWDDGQLTVRSLTTGIGHGTIVTKLVVPLDRVAPVQARDLAIKQLPLQIVLVDFLCQGYAVTGPLDLTGALTAQAGDLWHTLAGAGQFRIGAGKVVGSEALATLENVTRLGGALSGLVAGEKPVSLFASPLDFESIAGTFTIRNGVVTTRDLVYTSRPMKVTLAGDYALVSGRLDFDVLVRQGRREIQARLTGTAASPTVRIVPASVVRGIDRDKVQSGLSELLKKFR